MLVEELCTPLHVGDEWPATVVQLADKMAAKGQSSAGRRAYARQGVVDFEAKCVLRRMAEALLQIAPASADTTCGFHFRASTDAPPLVPTESPMDSIIRMKVMVPVPLRPAL